MSEEQPSNDDMAARPGRPRLLSDAERRQRLIDAAEPVFLEQGYHATTIADIVARAGMSKKTVYRHFASKEALFEALLADRLAVLSAPVRTRAGDPAAVLEKILEKIAFFVFSPKQLKLTRLLIAEAQRSPTMTQALHRQGLGRGRGTLETWIADQAARGILPIQDPIAAANLVFGLAIGEALLATLLGVDPIPSKDEIRWRIRKAVGIFMAGLREVEI